MPPTASTGIRVATVSPGAGTTRLMGKDSQAARRRAIQGYAREMVSTGVTKRPESDMPGRRSRLTTVCNRRSIRPSMGALGMVPAFTAAGLARLTAFRSKPTGPRLRAFSATISRSGPPRLSAERASRGIPASQRTRAAASIPSAVATQRKALAAAGKASVVAATLAEAAITCSASITRASLPFGVHNSSDAGAVFPQGMPRFAAKAPYLVTHSPQELSRTSHHTLSCR